MSESLFTTHKYVIPFKKFNEPIYLIPFGDIHRHAPLCHIRRWKEFLEWAKTKKRAYFLGMGDYDDMASGSERKILYGNYLHESSSKTIENLQRGHVNELCKEIEFMKGRIIGFLEGNHYGQFPNGTTTTQLMCEKLDAKYLGYSSFVRLCFRHSQENSKKSASLDIWAFHGKGSSSGRYVGGSVNSVQGMNEIADADIFLSGHDHKKWVAMKTKLTLTDSHGYLTLKHRKVLLGRTGSFLKGYEPGEESYVAASGMTPTDLGVIKIELTPKREEHEMPPSSLIKRQDRIHIDIHASI